MSKSYKKFVEESGLNQGDRVIVKRKTSTKAYGWANSWVSIMDLAIGKTGVIASNVNNIYGVNIKFDEHIIGGDSGRFPIFVLEKTKIQKPKSTFDITKVKPFTLNKSHNYLVSRAYVNFWIESDLICNAWKNKITELTSISKTPNKRVFKIPMSFLIAAIPESIEGAEALLALHFPEVYRNIERIEKATGQDMETNISETIDYIDNLPKFNIPGKDPVEQAFNLLLLIVSTYTK